MAKKDILSSFVSGIMGIESENNNESPGNVPQNSSIKKNLNANIKDETTVCSYKGKKSVIRKLKMIAAYEDSTLQDIVDKAFKSYISTWESEHSDVMLP